MAWLEVPGPGGSWSRGGIAPVGSWDATPLPPPYADLTGIDAAPADGAPEVLVDEQGGVIALSYVAGEPWDRLSIRQAP